MLKSLVLLFCLSVTLGVAYSASSGTTTVTPTASNSSTTVKPTTTAKPTASNKSSTAKPTTGNTTAKPTTGNTTAKPTTGNATAKPTTGNVTAKPTTGNATAKPTTGNATAKPTTGNATAKPTTGNATAKPTTGNATAKPTTGNATAKPTTGNATAKPSPTGKTTTVPPTYGDFSLQSSGKKNTTNYCLLAQFAATFKINYVANVSKNSSSNLVNKTAAIYLNGTNKNVNISGDCGLGNSTEAQLVLTWPNEQFYNLIMVFDKVANALEAKSNSTKWRVRNITLDVTLDGNPLFKGATVPWFTSSFNGSSSPTYDVGGYYSCDARDDSVKFETRTTNYAVLPVFEDVKLEPFVSKNSSDAFGKDKYQCSQDNPTHASTTTKEPPGNNDIVPIAVGCALAGLVLIVLIAYIIGRRKSHRGYEKV